MDSVIKIIKEDKKNEIIEIIKEKKCKNHALFYIDIIKNSMLFTSTTMIFLLLIFEKRNEKVSLALNISSCVSNSGVLCLSIISLHLKSHIQKLKKRIQQKINSNNDIVA